MHCDLQSFVLVSVLLSLRDITLPGALSGEPLFAGYDSDRDNLGSDFMAAAQP